jgi:potassium-transporting ATPase KdpC subunit
MRRQLVPALVMVLLFTVLTGLVYGLAFTGFAQLAFPHQANGSIIEENGKEVGSELIGQAFVDQQGNALTEYFQSRPSAATTSSDEESLAAPTSGAGYDPSLSLGSNLGPTNPCFVTDPHEPCRDDKDNVIPPIVVARVGAYRHLNGLGPNTAVPVDAVTASASGLDPHISVANALVQAKRVARERGIPLRRVLALVDDNTDGRGLGFLGEAGVNVLELNLPLYQLP